MVLSNRMKPSIFVLFATFSFLTADEMIMTNAKLRGNSWSLNPLEMKDITVSVQLRNVVCLKTRFWKRGNGLDPARKPEQVSWYASHFFQNFDQRSTNIKLEPSRTKPKWKSVMTKKLGPLITYPLISFCRLKSRSFALDSTVLSSCILRVSNLICYLELTRKKATFM